MRASYFSALAATSLAYSIVANPVPIPGYGIETLQWKIEVSPGHVEILNGTVQEIISQALEVNPDFKLPVSKRGAIDSAHLKDRSLSKRNVICGNFPSANKGRILEGIAYLNRLPAADRPTNGPGPGNCGRNTVSKTIDGWEYIANSAQHTVNTCASRADQVSGQNFESGNWNTIVRGDSC